MNRMAPGILIFNPTSGRTDKTPLARRLAARLRVLGAEADLVATRGSGDATVLAAAAADAGMSFVAVMGGDGSIREAGEALAGGEVPLLVLPFGTSNVLARSLGIPLNPEKAADLVLDGAVRRMDGGTANGRWFFFMCGAGVDAEMMAAISIPAKKLLGRASFYPTVARLLLTYRFPLLSVTADGERLEAGYAAVSNVSHYAGDYVLIPGADPFDGDLGLVAFAARSWRGLLPHYPHLARGSLLGRPGITHRAVRQVRIEGPPEVRWQLDGDTLGTLPVTIEARPGALPIYCPRPA
jgi:YegS/Rv2252/BmrU family lipid kinase